MLVGLFLSFLYRIGLLVLIPFIMLVIYVRWYYGTLENTKGLTGVVKPYFVGGSDPFFYKKVVCLEDIRNVKKYGPIFGVYKKQISILYYEGRQPQIFISDPELIRKVFIKDFDYFHNKRMGDFGHPLINEMMDILPYDKWKVVRTYLSPQLTTAKIRSMSFQMLDAINEWSQKIQAKSDSDGTFKFIPKEIFTALTTDIIARCVFGTKINALEDTDNTFVQLLRRLSFEEEDIGPMSSTVLSLPFLMKIAPFHPAEVLDYFGNLLKDILHTRRKSTTQNNTDFVDVMNEMIDKCDTLEFKKLGITETTVMCQAMIFLIAGFETTSTTLTVLCYRLSQNPEVQDKLIKEIDTYMEKHEGIIEHERIKELVYLTACINETLRMNPPLIRIERVCQKDWSHEPSELVIKKDMVVQVPIFAVHYDKKNFPEPNEFKPERFIPENKNNVNPYTFLPFGIGPHNCIGMRFAIEEILMTMISILKHGRIESCSDSKLRMLPGRTFLNSYEPFHLKMRKR